MYPQPVEEKLSLKDYIQKSQMKFDLSVEDHTIILNALHYYKKVEKLW